MSHRESPIDVQVTSGDNSRITRVGRFLRKTKLDELPQLINILLGQMSVVGPRPEVPKYVSFYLPAFERIMVTRPGLTDLASIEFINEEERLKGTSDVEGTYIKDILPEKLKLQDYYVQHQSLALDLKIIYQTILAILGSPRERQ